MNLHRRRKRVLPPAMLMGAIGLAVGLHLVVPLRQVVPISWRLWAAIPLLLGMALNLLADRMFKKVQTTVKPYEVSSVLVKNGVFGRTRNPMYLGMAMMVFGIVLALGSLTPMIVAVAVPVILDRVFIAPEERMLEETFGEEFRAYRRRVRRWI